MTGVVTLTVDQGERVVGGQQIGSIEAMKMESAMRAQADGIVERLAVPRARTSRRETCSSCSKSPTPSERREVVTKARGRSGRGHNAAPRPRGVPTVTDFTASARHRYPEKEEAAVRSRRTTGGRAFSRSHSPGPMPMRWKLSSVAAAMVYA